MSVAAEDGNIQITKLSLGPFGTNTYVVVCKATQESAVIDAPGEAEKVSAALKGSTPKFILMTHNHMDHTGVLEQLKSDLNVPVASHPVDASGLPVTPDMELNDGDELKVGRLSFKVLHTPGHTAGSVCFLYDKYLISGDTLFPGGPGKTGSPEAFKQILASLTEKIFSLPGETLVFPGHGESSQIQKERDNFEAFAAKGLDPDLCGDVSWA